MLPATDPAPPPATEAPPGRRGLVLWLVLAVVAGVALALVVHTVLRVRDESSYAFLAVQGTEPVTWNHCRAIPYQVNPKGGPSNWQDIVHEAVADIEEHSGFVFADRGTSVKTRLIGAGLYDGNEWEPVLIVWSDGFQDASLGGRTIGLGGGGVIEVDGIRRRVVGQVSLDSSVRDPTETRLVLEHELAHVLGLAHVDDRDQLMYPGYHGQPGLGAGDIAGLRRLHDVPCSF